MNFWCRLSGLVGILALGSLLFCSTNVRGEDVYNLTLKITLDAHPEEITWTLYDMYSWSGNNFHGAGKNYDPYEELEFTIQLNNSCYWLEFNDTNYWENADSDGTYGWYEMTLNGQAVTHGKQAIGNYSWSSYGYLVFCVDYFDIPQEGEFQTFKSENILYLDTYNFYGQIFAIPYYSYWYSWGTEFYNPDITDEAISTSFSIADGCYYFLLWSYNWDTYDYWYQLRINNITLITQAESLGESYGYVDFCTNDTGNSKYNYEYEEQDCTTIGDDEDTIEFQFNIKFDGWPEEVSWNLINEHTQETVLNGTGNNVDDYEEIWHADCISAGCYHFEIYDSWGDGMYHSGEYGWFRIYLDGKEISLGKQAVENDGLAMYFCTDFFIGGKNNLTIQNAGYNDTLFKIYDADGEPLLYKNDFIVPTFLTYLDEQLEATLHVTCGCYVLESTNPFDISVNGESDITFDFIPGDSDYQYTALICPSRRDEDGTCDSSDSASSSEGGKGSSSEGGKSSSEEGGRGGSNNSGSNSDSSGSIAAIVVVIIIVLIVVAGGIVVLRRKDKEEQEVNLEQGKRNLTDQLEEEPQQQGTGAAATTTSGATTGGWDMGTLGGDDDNDPEQPNTVTDQ